MLVDFFTLSWIDLGLIVFLTFILDVDCRGALAAAARDGFVDCLSFRSVYRNEYEEQRCIVRYMYMIT